MISKTIPVPLYWQVKGAIETEILEGKYQLGDIVSTEDTLMSRFDISRNTARTALATLEKEGYVKRKRQLGTVLVSQVGRKEDNVGVLFMQMHGHLYDFLAKQIISIFSDHGYHLFIQDLNAVKPERSLLSILSFQPSFLIIDGQNNELVQLLEKSAYGGRILFTLAYKYERRLPGAYVLQDQLEGVRMQADYLLKCGYENIVYYTHHLLPGHGTLKKMLDSTEEFLSTQGFNGRFRHVERPQQPIPAEQLVQILHSALCTTGKNTGVMCIQDYLAREVYQAANVLGWNIPEDIGIVGYYNTPWSTAFHPTLTSISINEKGIAEHLLEIIVNGQEREIYVKPELVVRESTREVLMTRAGK